MTMHVTRPSALAQVPYALLSVFIFTAIACRGKSDQTSQRAVVNLSDSTRKMIEDSLARYQGQQFGQASLQTLIDSLSRVSGSFAEAAGRWVYTGDQSVFGALAQYRDSAVLALVNCLDRMTPSKVTVGGRPVPLGVVCYSALQRVAYPTEAEDAEGAWAGVVEPTASVAELQAAKQAWMRVVRTRRYRLASTGSSGNSGDAFGLCTINGKEVRGPECEGDRAGVRRAIGLSALPACSIRSYRLLGVSSGV